MELARHHRMSILVEPAAMSTWLLPSEMLPTDSHQCFPWASPHVVQMPVWTRYIVLSIDICNWLVWASIHLWANKSVWHSFMLAYRRHETPKAREKRIFCLWKNCSHNVNTCTSFRVLILTVVHKASGDTCISWITRILNIGKLNLS